MENDIYCMQPQSMKDPAFFEALETANADLYVVVSFGKIIPETLFMLPKYRTINLHASLLPKYRGASPIHQALLCGDLETGNSVQFITKKLDEGDVIAQSRVPIDPEDNYTTLSEKLASDGVQLLLKAIADIESGKVVRTPQDGSKSSYAPIIVKENGLVSFVDSTAGEILNKWRAYCEWPGIFAPYGNSQNRENSRKEMPVSFTKIAVNAKINGEPGTILTADKKSFSVACKSGAIGILALKPAGKKELDYVSFVNGYRPTIGNYF